MIVDRREILQTAEECVCKSRAQTHGDAHSVFETAAGLWTVYLNHVVHPDEVAAMMALLKLARSQHGANNPDDYVDACGYAALAGEMATEVSNE